MASSKGKRNLSIKLLNKINNLEAVIGIVGVGYVGFELAKSVAGAGFKTIGLDIDEKKVEKINELNLTNLSATCDKSASANCDIILICVPTPLRENDLKPDLKFITRASEEVAQSLKEGQLIVVESSVAPLTTREIILPILQNGKKAGIDFFLANSPERIDPGNRNFNIFNTPKIVAGLEQNSLLLVKAFYKKFVKKVVPVSSLEVAEMSKMLENTFRFVNISLINELSDYTGSFGIDIHEVINASATKPYGFLPHYPGPGIGGHCIPVDPLYLLDHAYSLNFPLKLIEESIIINQRRAEKIVQKALELVNGKSLNGRTKILLVGVAYKAEVDDIRESPALRIWELASKAGADVSYYDPYVPHVNGSKSKELTDKLLEEQDVIIVTTNHGVIPYDRLLAANKPIIDTRNVFVYTSQSQIVKI